MTEPKTPMPERTKLAATKPWPLVAWTLMMLLVVWLALINIIARSYIEDDAFIHLEYARSVAHGQGFSFNGRISYGDTSPAWVAVLAVAWRLVGDWILTAKALAVVTAIFSLGVVGWFATQPLCASKTTACASPASTAFFTACLGLATNPYFTFWSTSGMEAVAAGGCIILAVHLCLTATRSTSRCLALLLVGALPLLRPEAILFLPFIACARGYVHFRSITGGSTTARAGIAQWIGECLLLAIPVLCWSAYAVSAFGTVEPNTNAAKRIVGGHGTVLRLLSVYVVGFGIAAAGIAAAWYFGKRDLQFARVQPLAYPSGLTGGSLTVAVLVAATLAIQAFYVVNNTAVQTRYALVWGLVLYACAAHELIRLYAGGGWRPVRAVIAATIIAQTLFTGVVTLPYLAGKAAAVLAQRTAYAAAVQLIPQDAPIAIYAIGQFAFETKHPLVDTGGITDVDVVRHFGDTKATLAWARARGADYYLGGTSWAGRELGRWNVPSPRWSLDPRKASVPDVLLLTTLDSQP